MLGEASSQILKIDAATAELFPALQLREAYAMRNRLTHGYTDVDLLVLWNTARDFVPGMVDAARLVADAGHRNDT